jgi:hypothetical protein
MHFRRYDTPRLVELFETAEFRIEQKSHLGFVLYPAFYLSKRLISFAILTHAPSAPRILPPR